MTKDYKLHTALGMVRDDAISKVEFHKKQLEHLKTISDGDLTRWRLFHEKQIAQAEIVEEWCFLRQMQISPD